MMKNILTTLALLFTSILLFGQEKEHLYFLETDTSWRQEMFLFPINFASDIDYKGVEDARFPVGWEKQDSPNFWSYAFGWDIQHDEAITEKRLEADLQKYFNGLMGMKETSVEITKNEEKDNISKFTGMVNTKDAFFTKEPMTLNVKLEKIYCLEKKKSVLLFKFSPKGFEADVWQHLEEVKISPAVASCGETKVKKIHDLVNTCYEYGKFNGSVLVAQNGKVIYKDGFGMANFEWDIPNKSDTKHRLASISKQFTAMLILQLVSENKLKLNVPISTYLPDYPKENADKITLHHLLTHTSGLPNYTSFPNYWEMMRNPHTPMDIVKSFENKSLEFTPGEKFAYSNSGYVLLGVIIEKITGKSFEEVIKDKIFEPIKMNNSGYEINRKVLKNRAAGYNKVANSYENANYINMSAAYTAGGLYSTVEDLYLWDQALYTEKLISQKYLDLYFTPHTPAWGGQHYGYGWEVGKMNVGNTKEQVQTIRHSGGVNGFNTLITRIPADKSLIVLLNNTSESPLNDMTTAINGILNEKSYTLPKRSLAYSLLDMIEKDGLATTLPKFQELKKSSEYHLSEREMNISGYQLLQAGKTKEAAAIFKLNTEIYPNSYNTYDSYGEALMVLGDTIQSIENYKKSVKLNPNNQHGKKILEDFGVNTASLMTKISVEHLRLLAGEYKAINQNRDWKIIIEEADGELFGKDGGYKYKLNPVGEDRFVNPDDGATVVFDAKDKNAITFVIFGKVKFEKVK